MNWSSFFSSTYGQQVVILIGAFTLFAALCIPAYFYAIRPARGTTEWMSRIDPVKFAPFKVLNPCWGDVAWALLAGFCAAMLRLIGYFLKYFFNSNLLQIMPQVIRTLLIYRLIPCAILSIALYFLLRSMFEQTLPAVCAAALGGLMQTGSLPAAALVTLSMLFLWRWMAADADAKFIPRFLLLPPALACYGLALVLYWPVVWLAPLYLLAYLYAQIYRWRKTTLPNRGMSLAISLLLLFFLALAAIICAWAYYCYSRGQLDQIVNLRLFLDVMPAKFIYRMNFLIVKSNLFSAIFVEDAILFISGMFSFVPILHGLFVRRDSCCIVPLVMLLPFAAVWLCGGMYLMLPLLIVALAWVLNIYATRGRHSYTIAFTVIAVAAFLVEHFL